MNIQSRIAKLEKTSAGRFHYDRRGLLMTSLMMHLTIGGLSLRDPADTIAARYADGLKETALDPEPEDGARIDHIRIWYLRGVASAGWRLDSAG